jgi:arsenate reductase
LTAKRIDFETVDYTKGRSLTVDELRQLLHRAGLKPQDVLRKNESAYREHVAGKNISDEQLVRVMVEHPELIQRPIVVRGNKAVLARSVDKLAELGIK